MYNLKHLYGIARNGLSDMLPALQQAFNDNPDDDKMDKVYGANPRRKILGLTVAGIVTGEVCARLAPDFGLNHLINWSAVVVGTIFALLIRRYLFDTEEATIEDYPWLAASLIPPAACLVLVAFVVQLVNGSVEFLRDAPAWAGIGAILVSAVNAYGVAAALTIAVAALCFSRNWWRALKDLAIQLLIFKIMVGITVLLIVDIGFVGPIVSQIIGQVFNIHFPDWLSDLADQLTLAALLLTAYTAVIGAAWTVCRQSFGTLLATGEVNILITIRTMARKPKKKKSRKDKKALPANEVEDRSG